MKSIIVTYLILFSFICNAQEYFNITQDTDNSSDIGINIIVEDSSYLVASESYFNGVNHLTYFRLNEIGDSINLKHFGNDSISMITGSESGITGKNNSYYSVGGYNDFDSINNDILLANINLQTLDTNWTIKYDIENSEFARSIIQTSDNGFLIGGYTQTYDGTTYGIPKWFVIKIDSNGNEEWRNTYVNGDLREIIQTIDGNYLLAGWYEPNSGFNYQHQLVKIDGLGNLIWQKRFGNSNSEGLSGVVELLDSSLIVYGNRNLDGNNKHSYYIAQLDFYGDTIWEKTYGNGNTGSNNIIRNLELLPDGSFVASGQGEPSGTGSNKTRGIIMKFCPNGELLWERKYGAEDFHSYLYDIELTNDGGFIATGSTKGTSGTQDLWVIKVDSLGCDSIGCAFAPEPCPIDTVPDGISSQIAESITFEVYPNPFNEMLVIKLNVTQSWSVTETKSLNIKMYNLLGAEVYKKGIPHSYLLLNDGIIIDGSQLQKGIYILEVSPLEGDGSGARNKIIKQ